MIFIITGGPATGKGTRSDILSRELDIAHISTGEILREVAETDVEVKEKLSRGELISDDIITRLLSDRLKKDDCSNGFILDGYPRTKNQIELLNGILDEMGVSINKVIELVVPDELAFRRILERKTCEKCGKMYGIDFPSKVENICDNCSGNLVIRTDDTKETLKKRIETYKANSKNILEYYKEKGLLKTVDASVNPEDIVKQALAND